MSYKAMKTQPDCPANTMPVSTTALRQFYVLILVACLFALLGACTASRSESNKGQSLRLNVGEVKELVMDTRADTTWQLTATSDNQEVVDVSHKPPIVGTNSSSTATAAGTAVFLIKGVTVGQARVVFSEKQTGTDGEGKSRKTYLVTVTTK